MRGQRLSNLLMVHDAPTTPKHKGRSKVLIDKRNMALYHRYYFYLRLHKVTYQRVLETLEDEFCLSANTIADIIADNAPVVTEICKSQPPIRTLKVKYPHYNWNAISFSLSKN